MANLSRFLYCSNWQRKNSEHSSLFLIVLTVLLSLSACNSDSSHELVTFSGPTMGTDYRISVKLPITSDHQVIEQKILDQLDLVNMSMSTYQTESELSQFNHMELGSVMTISDGFAEVLTEAIQISALTNGAFDVTVGDAVSAWGFGPDGAIASKPEQSILAGLKESVGYKNLQLESNNLAKLHPQTVIDLSAIAKGFAVDQVARLLRAEGLEDFLINVGGELRAAGLNQDRQIWRVAIEKPQTLGGIQQIIALDDAAIATSGDYRNYLIVAGQRYSHTIDPSSLEPKLHKLASVSVLAPKASTADALATALMVMGEQSGFEFAKRHHIPAYFVVRQENADKFDVKFTDEFAAILQ